MQHTVLYIKKYDSIPGSKKVGLIPFILPFYIKPFLPEGRLPPFLFL